METIDANRGPKFVQLIKPDLTIPIHYEYVYRRPTRLLCQSYPVFA